MLKALGMITILIFLFLVLIAFIVGFLVLAKKFNGLKEVLIILSTILLIVLLGFYFFGESDSYLIEKKLNELNMPPLKNYKIINSDDSQSLVDYHTNYEIAITEVDRNKFIKNIRDSKKYEKLIQNDFDDYISNEYSKELINNQIIQNYSIDENYYRTVTYPNSSRVLEIKIDTIKNNVNILDKAD